ncbi:MAG: plasmid mobilization relaxosome protein MobC, partial [Lachnospiraceae bacterium]|nr:plasmid mobilization relaxosome protein MobC [Lachnospiraceae bacterium]
KPEERKLIEEKMKLAGVKNMSAYIRKMAIDGYIIRLDLSELKEVTRLMRINANNLNQYAKKANETGSIYIDDINELKTQHEKIWQAIKKVYQGLSNLLDRDQHHNL